MVSAEERSGDAGGRTASSGGDSCCGSAVAAPAKEERICGGEEDDHYGQVVLSRVMVGEMDYLRSGVSSNNVSISRREKVF